MDFGDLDLQRVQTRRPNLQQLTINDPLATPTQAHFDNVRLPSATSTLSEPLTAIRWESPQLTPKPDFNYPVHQDLLPAVLQPTIQRDHESTPRSEPVLRKITKQNTKAQYIGANEAAFASVTPLVVQFDEDQIRSNAVAASRKGKMEDLNLMSSPPTPNNDDTPYIRFAIDQLTRDQDVAVPKPASTTTSSESYPVERIIPNMEPGYVSSPPKGHTREELALARKHRSSPGPDSGRLFRYNATRPLSPTPESDAVYIPQQFPQGSTSEVFIPIPAPKSLRYADLTFVPTILRPFSMIMLSLLCLLMTAAIIFCAVYSTSHHGLVTWSSGIYGGKYFVFSWLPQILAACIFIYIQCVMSATSRILPFALMAMDDAHLRGDALFLNLYPRSLLSPKLYDSYAMAIFWLAIFTIPLQSCLFAVISVDAEWRWTAVQGVAWTLVVLYLLLFLATVSTGLFFFRRTTGLKWDPRSLADLITLLPRSNCLLGYPGTDTMATKREIMEKLKVRHDRLGYWSTKAAAGPIFYCLGEEGVTTRQYTLESGRLQEKKEMPHSYSFDVEKNATLESRTTRFRYLPWFLRDTFVILWVVAASVILLALIVISFLPSTALRRGFQPLVKVAPNSTGFSPSNFLYSFIPSILGMLLYIIIQPLDMALRILQPWAELSHQDGQTASRSLLLDYTARFPLSCSIKALRNGHYRIAFVSLLAFLSILLPVLAGGLFFPLTTLSGEVRMIPAMPAFYVILAILGVYVLALASLIPSRRSLAFPHSVTCFAEIISFMHSSPILGDAAFSGPRSREDLIARLGATNANGIEKRYAFGSFTGRNGVECLGIERLGRRGQEVKILS